MKPGIFKKSQPSFLFVSNGYPVALEYLKITEPEKSYDRCKRELSNKLLDIAHLYSLNLSKLGYQAKAFIPNHELLQKMGGREQNKFLWILATPFSSAILFLKVYYYKVSENLLFP